MTPEDRTYLHLKYGSKDDIVDAFCAITPHNIDSAEAELLDSYIEWYISDDK